MTEYRKTLKFLGTTDTEIAGLLSFNNKQAWHQKKEKPIIEQAIVEHFRRMEVRPKNWKRDIKRIGEQFLNPEKLNSLLIRLVTKK